MIYVCMKSFFRFKYKNLNSGNVRSLLKCNPLRLLKQYKAWGC
ncbi:CLUMA_CG020021, isoform A [Clunio marinus]|uniref:CLUMA_CG020021, isoform A n=1 Tax=Clunio marinus TaxID=568069 RepID=A0A1J1J7Y7_9DIPT|nr:CLUMA_CG020021, isoform A [Clunio marinus]